MDDRFLKRKPKEFGEQLVFYITKCTSISLFILWKTFSGFSIKKVPWCLHHRQSPVLTRCWNHHFALVIKSSPKDVLLFMLYSYYSFEIRRIHDIVELWKQGCGIGDLFKELAALVVWKQKTIFFINKSCEIYFLWAFTLKKRGGEIKEHICLLSCADHSPPFNTNFSQLIISQLLPQPDTPRRNLHMLLQSWSHSAAGESWDPWSSSCRALDSSLSLKAAYVQRAWCSWGATRVGEEFLWIKEQQRVAARGIPSAIQLLLGLLLGGYPSYFCLEKQLLEWACFLYKRIHL